MRPLLSVFALACLVSASAQPLPQVSIEVEGRIPNEPKVTATMSIQADDRLQWSGPVGIELRGATSRTKYPKKQYAVETREADGSNANVSLLGLPEENDWILHAPYGDKTLVRNVLMYDLARELGHYAPRTRFVELTLNGDYRGLYILMEKIKRDDGRVALDEIDDDHLAGGYIVKIDKRSGGERGGWLSPIRAEGWGGSGRPLYQFHDPKPSDVSPEMAKRIETDVTAMEYALVDGDLSPIDTASFVDYFLLTELARNVDGFRLSAYFTRADDGLFHAGPLWDYNVSLGNADYYDGESPEGWQVFLRKSNDSFQIPAWWPLLAQNDTFRAHAVARWQELRSGILATRALHDRIDGYIAEIEDASLRNFERWPILGQRVWPNSFVGETYADEVAYLKDWLRQRAAWIDGELMPPAEVQGTR